MLRGTLKWAVLALLATSGALPDSHAQTPPPLLKDVLAAARGRLMSTDISTAGRLVQVAADETRRSSELHLKAHWFQDGLRLLGDAGTPAGGVRFLLTLDPAGHTAVEVQSYGGAAQAKQPPEANSNAVLGSSFAYEDIVDSQFLWTKQMVLPSAMYGARSCFVLKSEPGPGQRSHYSSVTTWIDQKTGAPVHMERVTKSGAVKELIFYDLRQTDSIWAARQIEAKVEGQPGSAFLIFERGSARAHLQRKDLELTAKPHGSAK